MLDACHETVHLPTGGGRRSWSVVATHETISKTIVDEGRTAVAWTADTACQSRVRAHDCRWCDSFARVCCAGSLIDLERVDCPECLREVFWITHDIVNASLTGVLKIVIRASARVVHVGLTSPLPAERDIKHDLVLAEELVDRADRVVDVGGIGQELKVSSRSAEGGWIWSATRYACRD